MNKLHGTSHITTETQNSVLIENGLLLMKELSQEGTFYGFEHKALLSRVGTVAYGHKKKNVWMTQVAEQKVKSLLP